jgi:chaperonin GroEL
MARDAQKGLLVLAEKIEGDALTMMVYNRVHNHYPCVAVKAPGFGERRKELLGDMAAQTCGTVICNELGMKLDKVVLNQLGQAKRVIVTHNTTTIVGGAGDKKLIDNRIEQIKARIAETPSDYDKEKLQERIAKLSSGVAVIKVGAATETEMKEKKMRIDDALHATKAAVEEGIVPGGGVALLRSAGVLTDANLGTLMAEEAIGVEIIRQALKSPLSQIVVNAGGSADVIAHEILKETNVNIGFDANDLTMKDLVAAGIIDPTKVVRSALQNAASIAALLLTTETVVVDLPSAKDESATQMGGYPMM